MCVVIANDTMFLIRVPSDDCTLGKGLTLYQDAVLSRVQDSLLIPAERRRLFCIHSKFNCFAFTPNSIQTTMQAVNTSLSPQDMKPHIITSITPANEKESDESDMNMLPMFPPFASPPPSEDEVHTSPEDGLSFSPSRFDWDVDEELLPNIEIEQAQAPAPAMRRASCPGKIEQPPNLRRRSNYPPLYYPQPSPATAPIHLNFVAEHQLSCSNHTANTNSSMSPLPWHGTGVAPRNTVLCGEILSHVVKEQQQLPVSTVADYTASNAEVAQSSVSAAPPPLLPRSNSACSSPSPSSFYGQRQQLQLDQKMQSQKTSGPQFSFQSYDDVLRWGTKNQQHCDLNTSGVAIPRCYPARLSIPSDEQFLDPVHNFLRSSCIEVFVCGMDYNSEGRCRGAKPNSIGQVGLRCVHCKHIRRSDRANQAVSYPSKTDHIFESVRNYQRIHFEACEYIPTKLKEEYAELVSHTYRKIQLKYLKIYFAEAACEMAWCNHPMVSSLVHLRIQVESPQRNFKQLWTLQKILLYSNISKTISSPRVTKDLRTRSFLTLPLQRPAKWLIIVDRKRQPLSMHPISLLSVTSGLSSFINSFLADHPHRSWVDVRTCLKSGTLFRVCAANTAP